MSKWRVYNKHPDGLTHNEKFKDEAISIKAGAFILMDYEDAVQFKGRFFPIRMNAMGVQDPSSYKCISIEPDDAKAEENVSNLTYRYVCHVDGKEFPNKQELEKYVEANFSDKIFKDDGLDEDLAKEKQAKKGK